MTAMYDDIIIATITTNDYYRDYITTTITKSTPSIITIANFISQVTTFIVSYYMKMWWYF